MGSPKREDTFGGGGAVAPMVSQGGQRRAAFFPVLLPALGAASFPRGHPHGRPAPTQWERHISRGVSPCLPSPWQFPVRRVLRELRRVALLSPSPCGETESLASQTEGGRGGFPGRFSRFPEQGREARGWRTARAPAVCVWSDGWRSFTSGDAGSVQRFRNGLWASTVGVVRATPPVSTALPQTEARV